MKKDRSWAQAKIGGTHLMRSGAWYQVVNDNDPTIVVLDVARRNVAIPRNSLEIIQARPDQFSVVVPAPGSPKGERGILDYMGVPYAVCPNSATRVHFSGRPEQLECPQCGHRGKVNWEGA